MRVLMVGILALGGLACAAQVQQEQVQDRRPAARDGGVRQVLESIVIPPIAHAPFTATLATEWVKYAADGATITLANERHIARDAQGRIYEERWILVPKNGNVKSTLNWIQIADPNRRTLYNCSTERHICDLQRYDPASDLSAASPRQRVLGSSRQGDANPASEDLGDRNIAGIETAGRRVTETIEAGRIGNDQPLTSMSEYWHSEELGINLLSIRTDPMFGKQTFTITEITPADPDAQLFELPGGFKVNDQRKNPPISW
jgi:hypothetical protein